MRSSHGRLLPLAAFILALPATAEAEYIPGEQKTLIVAPLNADYRLSGEGWVQLAVCYNWSCGTVSRLQFSAAELAQVQSAMQRCSGEDLHRRLQRIRIGIWRLQLLAQRYIPALANDRAVNDKEYDVEGRTDCVDNSTNTTTYLSILADLGAIPGWKVGKPAVRNLFTKDVHWTATLTDEASGDQWSVDTWFYPNGNPPLVSPLPDWKASHAAWEPPLDRFNPYPRSEDGLCPKRTAAGPAQRRRR